MFFILCFGKLSTEFLNGDDRGESQEQFDIRVLTLDHRRSLFPQFWESKNVRRGGEPIYVNMIPLDSKIHLLDRSRDCEILEKIAKPKRNGGLGFKDITSFNDSLLAKLGWRILKNPTCLLARCLLEKYCHSESFLKCKTPASASHGCRSVLIATSGHVSSPLMAEALAVRSAINFALSCGIDAISLLSDSQTLINTINLER
ncbi:hypothetical protein YC2023_121685 [Brassica napus]